MRKSRIKKKALQQTRVLTAREAAGKITDTLRSRVYKADGYSCVFCGSEQNLSIDHVMPVSQGGMTGFDNSYTACRSCNSKKGGRTPVEAKMKLQWGRFFKPAADRRLMLQKWFGKYRGLPEGRALSDGREAGLSIVELAYAYSSYRNWTLDHAMEYLMQTYGKDLKQ